MIGQKFIDIQKNLFFSMLASPCSRVNFLEFGYLKEFLTADNQFGHNTPGFQPISPSKLHFDSQKVVFSIL